MPGLPERFANLDYGPVPEAATPAFEWIAAHGGTFGHWIGGAWTPSGEPLPVFNPATAQPLAAVSRGETANVMRAVEAAAAAQPGWQALASSQRAHLLTALAHQLQQHGLLFALLETLTTGQPVRESRERAVPLAVHQVATAARWAQLGERAFAGWEAVGVVAQLDSWSWPLVTLAGKVAPALAAGCTVVLKPSPQAPLTALLFATLTARAGLPPGVVNVVTGDDQTGAVLVRQLAVAGVAVSGSATVMRQVREATAGRGTRFILAPEGTLAVLVFADADLESAVAETVEALLGSQGRFGRASLRLLLQESCAGPFLTQLRARLERLRPGDPLDLTTDWGPLAAPGQRERLQRLCHRGVAEGATLWQPAWVLPAEGWWFPPTLFTNVAPTGTLARDLTGGPSLVVLTFRTPEEAMTLTTTLPSLHAASIWTENGSTALAVAHQVQASTVWVNVVDQLAAPHLIDRSVLLDYLRPRWRRVSPPPTGTQQQAQHAPALQRRDDQTGWLFIGGSQVRPASGISRPVVTPAGRLLGTVGAGGPQDIQRAVAAARAAAPWSQLPAARRAHLLEALAEQLAARATELTRSLLRQNGGSARQARREVELGLQRLFRAAAWAAQGGGQVQETPGGGLLLALSEPVGVLGIVCPPERPLLAFLSLLAPALALGNRVVVVPSERHPLAALDVVRLFQSSDLPAGAVNLVTGESGPLAAALAAHADVDGLWYFAGGDIAAVEQLAASTRKRLWTGDHPFAWERDGEGEAFLYLATRRKHLRIAP
ncbi:MAG: aldehyde dehydrogenase [Dehalococcoidia bacterium]|nr:MAG: aldehyde dehydrogenase [Dehalococcoidia bacterium]